MDFIVCRTFAQQFGDDKNAAVVNCMNAFQQFFLRTFGITPNIQTVNMLFQRAERFHQGALKIITNAHDLSGSFHLCRQRPFCLKKFIKRKSRNLNDAVVKRRLKTGIRLLCNRIRYLI